MTKSTMPKEAHMQEHVILVAVTATAPSREEAEQMVCRHLPRPGLIDATLPGEPRIESWWVAEDDRRDRSDNDSAVFVHPGAQAKASKVLYDLGLTPACNLVVPEPTRFEVPE